MLRKEFTKTITVVMCVLFAGSIVFLSSCKKTSSEPPTTPKQESSNVETSKPATPAASAPAAPATEAAKIQTPQPETKKPADSNQPKTTSSDSAGAIPADWVAIDINLPKAMFVGTPLSANVPNLEKPLGKARPPFLAPKGTTNVALRKPIKSSDEWPIIGKVNYITDGEKSAADGYYVELMPGKQYVTIDLEKTYQIWAIVIWHYHMQARIYKDVIVQVADDPNCTKNVQMVFNNDDDNSSEMGKGTNMNYTETNEGKLIDAKGVKGRYVRLYSNGNNENDLNHYVEVEVYATPVE
jgi:hypothetical protein